jgi:hypothetical protein
MITLATPLDSFSTLVARTYRWARRAFWIAIGLGASVIVLQAIQFAETLAAVHPLLAWVVMLMLTVPLLAWIAWRGFIYLGTPRVVRPPELPPLESGWNETHRRLYLDFAARYLERQSGNPRLPGEYRNRIPGALRAIAEPLAPAESDHAVAAARALTARVEGAMDEVLEPLDAEARRLIRRAAVEVSLATAISPSIMLDALITLSRNVDLMSRLADLYYGRPGFRGTLRVIRDVLGSAIMAGALEMVSDNVAAALSEMTGSWGSRLFGPVGQGMVNGLVTMRLGAGARQRCRSLSGSRTAWVPWRLSDYRRALTKLYEWVSEEAGPRVTRPLAGWLEMAGSAARATVRQGVEKTRSAKTRWWTRLFKRSPGADQDSSGEPPPSPESEPARAQDPLIRSGLLD